MGASEHGPVPMKIAKLHGGVVIDLWGPNDACRCTEPIQCPDCIAIGDRLIAGAWCRPDGTPYTPAELGHIIRPSTLLARLTDDELAAFLGAILGVAPASLTEQQRAMWRLVLRSVAATEIYSWEAQPLLEQILGPTRAAEITAEDPS